MSIGIDAITSSDASLSHYSGRKLVCHFCGWCLALEKFWGGGRHRLSKYCACRGAQGARAGRAVPDPPGGFVHDYVPFYFAPRSPMLFAINRGSVAGCKWRQDDIVHFETTVQNVEALARPFVFYDRNATLAFSTPYTDLTHLDAAIAWELLTEAPQLDGFCKFWQNRTTDARYADRMERRQAEFLVKGDLPLRCVTRLGVIDEKRMKQVQELASQAGVALDVLMAQGWYF